MATTAWSQQIDGKPKTLAISILLALCAFNLMWVHYVSDWVRKKWFPDQAISWQYKLSRWAVLVAILSHPILINGYLVKNNYGFPPNGYKEYYGSAIVPFIFLGVLSLLAFLGFEFKKWLKDKPVWQAIVHLNNLAMVLILIHAFKLGPVTDSPWYFWIWSLQAMVLCFILAYNYMNQKINILKYSGVAIAFAGLLLSGWFIVQKVTNNSSDQQAIIQNPIQPVSQPTKTAAKITINDLSKNNGLSGAKCWVAVNKTVYDASNDRNWRNGQHTPSRGQAKCGEDLSDVISKSPHGESALSSLVKIGELQ